ncbi:hypothetical protein B0T26DRAFT_633868 [Lasiosphaeria miniovina]|uniref:Acetylserotonin methytransferase-like protein n=1 Tax=Lasiosphaeria miniovina TaxID=1954250 RepID=A0AA40BG28_9PEZI|nr:uncharacterized protein B0T26DRAFT_633868 [Lasiosphaeria miniovina]KAK0733559.1 hypothetical protein B0T26DRAFT_633868 [Lasiosphaeria miniovina]
MSAAPPTTGGGFSLFPNTSVAPRPPSRNQIARPQRDQTPQGRPSISAEATPPRVGRQPSVRRQTSVREGKQKQPSNNPWQAALDAQKQQQQQQQSEETPEQELETQQQQQFQPPPQQYFQPPPQQQQQRPSVVTAALSPAAEAATRTLSPATVTDVPPRCETAFSEARTLVRSPSTRSRSSIAKPPIAYVPGGGSSSSAAGPSTEPPPIRSIFPQYNPEIPLDRQDYYPTQASPVHIPQAAISRPLYSPRGEEPRSPPAARSPPAISPAPTATAGGSRWPAGAHAQEPHVIPPVSTTGELRALWKVTNGWKASALEGRLFCLKMTAERDAPIYTLSSASSQPFYNLRLDPTSASALVSLSRYDPSKPYKGLLASSPSISGTPSPRASSSSKSESKHDAKYWHEVLGTTLEEKARKQPPNDGLVAQLWPSAAARLAMDRANDATTVALAEHECARLVWDADSGYHYLVHPALAMPFCVTVERNPAFSRTEYTLEHLESPQHLGRLTRDGTGAGWLEVDTSIASKIDAVYLVDVVVAALVLVAHSDDLWTHVEVFEPPPVFGGPEGSLTSKFDRRSSKGSRTSRRMSSRLSRASQRDSRREERLRRKETTTKKPAKTRMEQFEVDIESQISELGKKDRQKEKEKTPGLARGIFTLLSIIFKCIIWIVTMAFKALKAVLRCAKSEKL